MTNKTAKRKVIVKFGEWLHKITDAINVNLAIKMAKKIARKRGEDIYLVRDEGKLKLINETHYLLCGRNLIHIAYHDE
jgi:hypothetical protein